MFDRGVNRVEGQYFMGGNNNLLYLIANVGAWCVCLQCAMGLAYQLHQYWVTAHLYRTYGGLRWVHVWRTLRYAWRSGNRTVLWAPGTCAVLGLVVIVSIGVQVPVSFIAMISLVQLLVWALHGTPPSVLLLGTSRPQMTNLREHLERGLYPYRVVVLLDPHTAIHDTHTKFSRQLMEPDNLRTRDDDEWREVVYSLTDTVPFTVVDTRVPTPGVVEETRRMLGDEYFFSTMFIVDEDGSAPSREAVTDAPALPEANTVRAGEVVQALRARGLNRTTSPDDVPGLRDYKRPSGDI